MNKGLELSADEEEEEEKKFLTVIPDGKILWKVNSSRIHREFRDFLIVQAVQRRIDTSAGNLMRVMLTLMNETSPWLDVSSHIHQVSGIILLWTRCISTSKISGTFALWGGWGMGVRIVISRNIPSYKP